MGVGFRKGVHLVSYSNRHTVGNTIGELDQEDRIPQSFLRMKAYAWKPEYYSKKQNKVSLNNMINCQNKDSENSENGTERDTKSKC